MDVGWQPQLGAGRHGEKPSWEPATCVGPKLILAVAGGTMAQPGQLRCPSLPYHSYICSRCGAVHTAPRPAALKMPGQPWPNACAALLSCSASCGSRVRGSARAQPDGHRAVGVGCLAPHLAVPAWGRLLTRLLSPRRGTAFAFLPSPNSLTPCCLAMICGLCQDPGVPAPRGKGPHAAQLCVLGVSQATGKEFGVKSCCFGERLLSTAPVSDRQAGPASRQAVPVVPQAWGLAGPGERVGVLRQWVQRVFEARVDAWLMSHICRGWEGAEGWGKTPKGFPAACTLCKGPVCHVLPGCLCLSCLLPRISAHIPLALLGKGRGRAVGTVHRQPGASASLPAPWPGACPHSAPWGGEKLTQG